ncbi:MAG: hypothetical protein EBZ59_01030 [Planctomycetia bacterium]|nr:hypothetical protein [Planctomycetia bacterium]
MLKRIVLPSGFGQTCNQLFQIGHWIPAALRAGVPLYFPGFSPYSAWFRGTDRQRCPCFPRNAPPLGPAESMLSSLCARAARVQGRLVEPLFTLAGMLPGVVTYSCDERGAGGVTAPSAVLAEPRVAAGRSLWARGWHCRDEPGMREHAAAIREFFTPVAEVQRRVDACIQPLRREGALLVGVHLRRGDYRHWSGGRYLYDDDTICRLMHQTREALPGRTVRFLMVSNQAIDRHGYRGLDIGLGPGDPPGDLYALASCDYLLGPPSTFTMWASFFGTVPLYCIDDPTVAPRLDRFAVSIG